MSVYQITLKRLETLSDPCETILRIYQLINQCAASGPATFSRSDKPQKSKMWIYDVLYYFSNT